MTDDPDELPIREYITKGATEGALAAAQRITDAIGVSLSEVLAVLQETAHHRVAAQPAGASASALAPSVITVSGGLALGRLGFGETAASRSETSVSVYLEDAGRGADDLLSTVRHADVENLGSQSRFDLAAMSLRTRLLMAVVLISAVYPVLPPVVQKYLLEEVGLAAAVAQIFSLLKF